MSKHNFLWCYDIMPCAVNLVHYYCHPLDVVLRPWYILVYMNELCICLAELQSRMCWCCIAFTVIWMFNHLAYTAVDFRCIIFVNVLYNINNCFKTFEVYTSFSFHMQYFVYWIFVYNNNYCINEIYEWSQYIVCILYCICRKIKCMLCYNIYNDNQRVLLTI